MSEPAQKKIKVERQDVDTDLVRTDQEHLTATIRLAEDRFATSNSLFRLFLQTKAEHFVSADRVVFVAQREDRIVDVWKGLVKHNFLSVPVLQKTENKYYGFVELPDIVRYLVKTYNQENLRGEQSFWAQVEAEKVFGQLRVNDLMKSPAGRGNPFHPVSKGYSLMHAVEILARENHCHRVPVIDPEDGQLINMITQSQVIAFLNKNIHELGNKREKPLSECKQFFKPVHCVNENDLAIDAFNRMVETNVTGAAVINADGSLVGNLSVRDMKLVGYDVRLFWRFYQSVKNYVVKLKREYSVVHNRPKHVIFATATDTLQAVIERLATNGVHRLYLVDNAESMKPIGVVSLKDVLSEVITV